MGACIKKSLRSPENRLQIMSNLKISWRHAPDPDPPHTKSILQGPTFCIWPSPPPPPPLPILLSALCVCLLACLWLLTPNLMSNFQYLNIHVHFGPVEDKNEGLLPECSVSIKEAWSEVEATSTTDNDRQSTLLTSGKNFAQWLRTLQVGGMHKLMIKLRLNSS